MKFSHIVVFCTLVLIVASCRHHWPNEGKVKTIYSSASRDTLTCYYDNNGQLAYYTAKDYKTAYERRKNTIIETTHGGSKVTMYLNSRGLVDSLVDIDTMRAFADGSPKKGIRPVRSFRYAGVHVLSYLDGGIASRNAGIICKKFDYDTAGYLIHQTEYVNGNHWAEADSRIENGNIVSYSIRYFFSDTVMTVNPKDMSVDTKVMKLADRTFTYTFDTEKENSLMMTGLFGKCSKNLAVKMSDHAGAGKDSTLAKYSYTFDDKDRVSTLIEATEGKRDTFMFTYY